MLKVTGERQVGATLEEIRDDHKERYLWARAQLNETDAVLDAGCGVGYGSMLLSEQVQSVHAVDVSADAIAYARRYWVRSNVTHDVQDLHFLELPVATKYDAIVAFEIIEHLIEPRLFLQRARKHLHAKGRLYISVPNEIQIPHTVDLNPFHIRHYTPTEVTELLSESGYKVNVILSQDAKELTPGTSGKFLIVEATPTDADEYPDEFAQLCKNSVTAGAALIVARATVLAKATKDIRALKFRLDEATKKTTAEPQGAQRGEVAVVLDTISQRIQLIENALVSDLRQRSYLLETSERAARDNLFTAQFQIIRLEDEKRALSAELKRFEERKTEQSEELSRLQTRVSEERELRDVLKTNQADVEKLTKQADDWKTKSQNLSAKLLAAVAENEVLRKTNESLADELERKRHGTTNESNSAAEMRKEPPSVGYLWRKLKHHRFYGPFLTKVVLNSTGLRRKRKVFRR